MGHDHLGTDTIHSVCGKRYKVRNTTTPVPVTTFRDVRLFLITPSARLRPERGDTVTSISTCDTVMRRGVMR